MYHIDESPILVEKERKKRTKPEQCKVFADHFCKDTNPVYYGGALYLYRDKCYREQQEPEVAVQRWFLEKGICVSPTYVNDTLNKIKAIAYMDPARFPG